MVELFELRAILLSHQPEKYGSWRGLGRESQIWPTLKSLLDEKNRAFHNQVPCIHGTDSGASVSCVSVALWCLKSALQRMFYLSTGVYLCDAKNRASWGVGLSACSLGQLDMAWWMILVCSSLHAIDRGGL